MVNENISVQLDLFLKSHNTGAFWESFIYGVTTLEQRIYGFLRSVQVEHADVKKGDRRQIWAVAGPS